jgi:heptose-I-phosphate ethanolaminephosphotransferase
MYRNSSTVLVYLSDHGEEVYDYRNHLGRTHERKKTPQSLKYQYQIPFVVWCSDKYIEKHPDIVNSLRHAMDKPLLSSDISHMLLSLGAIKSPYYLPDKDILNEHYQCGKRMIQDRIDYDKIMNNE